MTQEVFRDFWSTPNRDIPVRIPRVPACSGRIWTISLVGFCRCQLLGALGSLCLTIRRSQQSETGGFILVPRSSWYRYSLLTKRLVGGSKFPLNDLTEHWSEPLAALLSRPEFMREFYVFEMFAVAIGRSVPSR